MTDDSAADAIDLTLAPGEHLEAFVWRCGDDICNCSQPVIERVTPPNCARQWPKRERVWEGSFISCADRDGRALQLRELRAAAKRFRVSAVRQ